MAVKFHPGCYIAYFNAGANMLEDYPSEHATFVQCKPDVVQTSILLQRCPYFLDNVNLTVYMYRRRVVTLAGLKMDFRGSENRKTYKIRTP